MVKDPHQEVKRGREAVLQKTPPSAGTWSFFLRSKGFVPYLRHPILGSCNGAMSPKISDSENQWELKPTDPKRNRAVGS